MAPLLLPVILGGKVNWRFSACRQSHRMRMRFSYAVSAVTHALLLGALALANDWLRPEFAVRSGQAAPNAQPSAQPRTVAQPLDTRIEPDLRATIEIDAPPFPDWTEPVPPPPTAADLDERLVLRPPIEETLRRRSERSMEVVLLPTADPVPLDRPETAPELDGRPLLPLWTPVPEEMIPLPDRQQPERPLVAARPVATTEVADPGEAETPVESSITPPGAAPLQPGAGVSRRIPSPTDWRPGVALAGDRSGRPRGRRADRAVVGTSAAGSVGPRRRPQLAVCAGPAGG
jgi:hypothetical protein